MFKRTPPDIFHSCFNDPFMLKRINVKFQMERFHLYVLSRRYSCLNFQAPEIELYKGIIKQHHINVANYFCESSDVLSYQAKMTIFLRVFILNGRFFSN